MSDAADTIRKYVVEHFLWPEGQSSVSGAYFRDIAEVAHDALLPLADGVPGAVYEVLNTEEFEVAEGRQFQDFEARELLVKLLDEVDENGQWLIKLATDETEKWHVRRDAIRFLARRGDHEKLARLVDVLKDPEENIEVREALALAYGEAGVHEMIPVIREEYEKAQSANDLSALMKDDLRAALLMLGETDILRESIRLMFEPETLDGRGFVLPNPHHIEPFKRNSAWLEMAISELAPDCDLENNLEGLIWIAVNDSMSTVRRWALDEISEMGTADAGKAVVSGLNDENWMVSCTTMHKILEMESPPVDELLKVLGDEALPCDFRLWASLTLLNLDHNLEVTDFLLANSGIPLSIAVPEVVVDAVISNEISGFWIGSDVRWLVRKKFIKNIESTGFAAKVNLLVSGLEENGLSVLKLEEYRGMETDEEEAGVSLVDVEGWELALSHRGPSCSFACSWWRRSVHDDVPADLQSRCREVAEDAGFHWLDREQCVQDFPGLPILYEENPGSYSVAEMVFFRREQ